MDNPEPTKEENLRSWWEKVGRERAWEILQKKKPSEKTKENWRVRRARRPLSELKREWIEIIKIAKDAVKEMIDEE